MGHFPSNPLLFLRKKAMPKNNSVTIPPETRVKDPQYATQGLVVRQGEVWCAICSKGLTNDKQTINRHIDCDSHKINRDQKGKQRKITEFLDQGKEFVADVVALMSQLNICPRKVPFLRAFFAKYMENWVQYLPSDMAAARTEFYEAQMHYIKERNNGHYIALEVDEADAPPNQFLAAHTTTVDVSDDGVDTFTALALMCAVEGRGPNGGLESSETSEFISDKMFTNSSKRNGKNTSPRTFS